MPAFPWDLPLSPTFNEDDWDAIALPPDTQGVADPSSPPDSPEINLCRAVLENAVFEYALYRNRENLKHRQRAWEVWQWFCSDDVEYIYSFCAICDILRLDPGYIRRALPAITREGHQLQKKRRRRR